MLFYWFLCAWRPLITVLFVVFDYYAAYTSSLICWCWCCQWLRAARSYPMSSHLSCRLNLLLPSSWLFTLCAHSTGCRRSVSAGCLMLRWAADGRTSWTSEHSPLLVLPSAFLQSTFRYFRASSVKRRPTAQDLWMPVWQLSFLPTLWSHQRFEVVLQL